MAVVDVVKMDYIAREPAGEHDFSIPFSNIITQHASWERPYRKSITVTAGFHRMAASVRKIQHIFETRQAISEGAGELVEAELEYLFVKARSIFDLLHEIVTDIWKTKIRLLNPEAEARRRSFTFKPSFARVALDGERCRTAEEIAERFTFSPTLASQYSHWAPFFAFVRKYRDALIHKGRDVVLIYVTERGFCIDDRSKFFKDLDFWTDAHYLNANLRSLYPLLAHLVVGTIDACSNIIAGLSQDVALPPPVAPGYTIFYRGYNNRVLLRLRDVAFGGDPWWSCDLGRREDADLESIRTRAYFLFENRTGRRWWDSRENWIEAEEQCRSRPRRAVQQDELRRPPDDVE